MLRIAILLAIVCIMFRWAFGKWPWQMLDPPSTRSQALFRARKLLGVEEGASREDIKAAHRRIIAMVHPDKGGSTAQVHEANDARDLLLNALPSAGVALDEDDTGLR
ncbi:MAG: J domain-containing protein [Pseudomonadota bacterium]